MKQKKYYEELDIQVFLHGGMDILTASDGGTMTPEGDYDDGGGWND